MKKRRKEKSDVVERYSYFWLTTDKKRLARKTAYLEEEKELGKGTESKNKALGKFTSEEKLLSATFYSTSFSFSLTWYCRSELQAIPIRFLCVFGFCFSASSNFEVGEFQ